MKFESIFSQMIEGDILTLTMLRHKDEMKIIATVSDQDNETKMTISTIGAPKEFDSVDDPFSFVEALKETQEIRTIKQQWKEQADAKRASEASKRTSTTPSSPKEDKLMKEIESQRSKKNHSAVYTLVKEALKKDPKSTKLTTYLVEAELGMGMGTMFPQEPAKLEEVMPVEATVTTTLVCSACDEECEELNSEGLCSICATNTDDIDEDAPENL